MSAYADMYSVIRNEQMMQLINAMLYANGRQMPEGHRHTFIRRMEEESRTGPRERAPRVTPAFLAGAGIKMEPAEKPTHPSVTES